MIRITERRFYRKVNKTSRDYDKQEIKRITIWLLGIIPIFSRDKVISGSIEY